MSNFFWVNDSSKQISIVEIAVQFLYDWIIREFGRLAQNERRDDRDENQGEGLSPPLHFVLATLTGIGQFSSVQLSCSQSWYQATVENSENQQGNYHPEDEESYSFVPDEVVLLFPELGGHSEDEVAPQAVVRQLPHNQQGNYQPKDNVYTRSSCQHYVSGLMVLSLSRPVCFWSYVPSRFFEPHFVQRPYISVKWQETNLRTFARLMFNLCRSDLSPCSQ